jgi:hypothetical protein
MTVKRYEIWADEDIEFDSPSIPYIDFEEDPNGEWVKYDDYKELVKYVQHICKSGLNENFKKYINNLIEED